MELLEIREDGSRLDGAVLRLDGYDYPVTLKPPFDTKGEADLDWYFEEHLHYPFMEQVRAREAGASITAYGEALFRQLFVEDAAREAYGKLKDRAYPGALCLEIVGSPTFQGLHWEALKDPRLPKPFAFDLPIVRRGTAKAPAVEAKAADSPTLRLLVVTARPGEAQDVGYRTITRPLLAALHQAALRVEVELVRPGTWRALVERLEAATRDHGAGLFHAIHFDLHGALLDHGTFTVAGQQATKANRLTFRSRWGRGDLPPYEGVKGFLSFEREQGTGSDLAEAGEVAALLLKHRIPIVILNACQSGKQVGASETSLGAKLLEAGVQSVLAMAWSVTVSAAEKLIPVLYNELFAGRPLSTAVLAARRELQGDRRRRAAFNEVIELEDWLLPVVYQNREPKLAFRDFTPAEAEAWLTEVTYRFPEPETAYGFFGRDIDVLRIEKRVLAQRNLVLVQGMGGAGKTTLLRHLAHWWEQTGLVERTFYFGWDERAWTRAQILRAIAPHVLKPDLLQVFDALPEAAQQEAVVRTLRADRHLLILDNLESVTGAVLAIPHSIDQGQQQALQELLKALAGGRSLVLLGSRGDEAWLAKGTFEQNVHRLEGLDWEAASIMADAVLRQVGAEARREESAFRDLMRLLAGYPLALQVVLPNLAEKSSAEVLETLQKGLTGIEPAAAADTAVAKTQHLMTCIEYSYSNLDPQAQDLLLCFAPFSGVIDTDFADPYTLGLGEEPALAGLPLHLLLDVLERARGLGLLVRDSNNPRLLRPQPALTWFLTTRLGTPEQAERGQAIRHAFCLTYESIAKQLLYYQTSTDDPKKRHMARDLVNQEYANFCTALRISLDEKIPITSLHTLLISNFDVIQDDLRALELGEQLIADMERIPPEYLTDSEGLQAFGVVSDIGNRQQRLNRFDAAQESYERALALLERSAFSRAKLAPMRGAMLHQLGLVYQRQRKLVEAGEYYKNAIPTFLEFDFVRECGQTYFQLGRIAQEQRDWDQAESYFRQAMDIWKKFNDIYYIASSLHQLARVAQEREKFSLAISGYKDAADLFFSFGDHINAAKSYQGIGSVAAEMGEFNDAESYFKRALAINLSTPSRQHAAGIYHELGNLAIKQGNIKEAESYFKESIKIHRDFNNYFGVAHIYYLLGILAQNQMQWSKAETLYVEALDIMLSLDERDFTSIILERFSKMWQESGVDSIVSAVARCMGIEFDEASAILKRHHCVD